MLKGFGLFHSTAFEDTEEKKRNRDRTIEFIGRHGMDAFADSFVSPLFFHKNREALSKDIRFMQEICRNTNSEGVVATVKAMRDRLERLETLKHAKVPVMFIIGKDDSAVPLEKSLEQCYLPAKHQVCILSDTGHMGMFEKVEESKASVRDFLKLGYH
jgi:pimeloyl-ACP methyl ester carboxylesterase